MESFQYLHKGRIITRFDFSNSDYAEIQSRIVVFRNFMVLQPPRSVLTLTDITGVTANGKTVDLLKAWALHNKPYVIAGAVVGLSPARRMLVAAVNYFTKRDIKLFNNAEQASDWLVGQKQDIIMQIKQPRP